MRIPRTLITSDPARALEFWEREDRAVVYKAFNQRGLVWTPTRLLTEQDAAMLGNVRFAPVIFQSLVPGVRDVRVTAIGDQVFATEFDIEREGLLDFACSSVLCHAGPTTCRPT